MEIELTKHSDAIICTLYKAYLERRKDKKTINESRRFGSAKDVHREYFSEWLFDDIETGCYELKQKSLIQAICADGTIVRMSLSDEGLLYMENRFKNKINNVVNYLKDIASLLAPFV